MDSLTDKEAIIATVEQTLDFGDYQHIDELINQIRNEKIYFAGLGKVMIGLEQKRYNFYQFMYFLNPRSNTIYKLDDIH